MMRAANPRKFRPARPTNSQQIRISRPNSSSGDLEQKSKSLKDINLFRANVLVFPLQASVFFYVFRGDKKGKLTWYICPAGKYTYRNGKYLISVLHLLIGNSKNIIVLLNAIFLFNFKHTRSNQFQADVVFNPRKRQGNCFSDVFRR